MKLVFVHGAGDSSLSFYFQLRHFRNSKGIDLPGHPFGKPCTSIETYAEWVRGFIAARRYKDVVLCGHSMGGAIAQYCGLTYPEELKAIILIGTGARLRVHPQYLQETKEAQRNAMRWQQNQRIALANVDCEVREIMMRRAMEIGPAVLHNDLLCCDKFDIMDSVGHIRVPTHVVCGAEDVMTPVKYSTYLANKIAGSHKTIIEEATHYVQLERPQAVNNTINSFLTTLR